MRFMWVEWWAWRCLKDLYGPYIYDIVFSLKTDFYLGTYLFGTVLGSFAPSYSCVLWYFDAYVDTLNISCFEGKCTHKKTPSVFFLWFFPLFSGIFGFRHHGGMWPKNSTAHQLMDLTFLSRARDSKKNDSNKSVALKSWHFKILRKVFKAQGTAFTDKLLKYTVNFTAASATP